MTENSTSHPSNSKVYDLLDRKGGFIKRGTKIEAQSQNLYRATVHILLTNPEGKYLVCRRPFSARVYPGMWSSSAGGHVESGEAHEEAAKRELKEELSYKADLTYIGESLIELPERKNIQFLYYGSFQSVTELVFDPKEISETRLLSDEELRIRISSEKNSFTEEFIAAYDLLQLTKHNDAQ